MEDLPPRFNSAVFNSSAFSSGNPITKIDTDRLYVPLKALGPSGSSSPGKIIVADNFGQIGINRASGGDLLTLTSSATNARSTIKFTTDAQSWEFGSRGSTAQYPNSIYFYNGLFRFVMNQSGDVQIFSTTSSSSKTTGAFIVDGGVGIGGRLNCDSFQTYSNVASISKVTGSIITNSLGVANKINAENLQLYGTTNSTNKTTGAFIVDGGIGCNSTITADRVRIDSSGSHLTLISGGTQGFLEQVQSDDILRIVRGYALNVGTNGLRIQSGSTAAARFPIDLGNGSADIMICLSTNTGSNPIYGIGANNVNMIYSSGGGHRWTLSTSGTIGSDLMSLGSTGTLTTTQNLVAGTGIFVKQGFNLTGRTGNGIALHCANSTYSEIFTYDYTANQVKDMRIGNTIYISDQNKFVSIGGGTTQPNYPLTVVGNFSTSFAGAYGYIALAGANTGVGTGVVPVTASFQHRVWCSEVNVFSDSRLKDNINTIDTADALEFVKNVNPVHFHWKSDELKQRALGYIAQDVLKHCKFPELVCLGPDAELEEEIDDDGFLSPAGQRFVVSYQNAVPILHKALAASFERLDAQKAEIAELRALLDNKSDKRSKK